MTRLLLCAVIYFFSYSVFALVNINTASKAELTSLEGINTALAQAIIDYRNTNGPFKARDDLLKVKGITVVELNKIRDQISVSRAAKPPIVWGDKLEINTATKEELSAHPGIGPVKAQAIVDYRNANGPFKTAEDVMKVRGIEEGTFSKMKDSISVGPYTTPTRPVPTPTRPVPTPTSPVPKPTRPVPTASRLVETVVATDKYFAGLSQSSIVFSTPPAMDEDATDKVLLWLDPTATLSSLEDELKALVGQSQRVEGATGVKWAPRTRATLSSPGFDITPQPTIEQAVSAVKRTEWAWQIHPKDSGTQTLHLAIEAILPSGDKDSYRIITTFDRDIDVQVTAPSFVKHNWQWLAATLLIPLAIGLWNRKHPPPRPP